MNIIRFCALTLTLLVFAPNAVAQTGGARVDTVSIAGSLPAPRDAIVVLPEGYGESGARYPVLYLLHGLWGGHQDWLVRSNLVEYTEDSPLIVVLPDAADSWYTNSATDPELRYEDYIGEDLVAYMDSHYRTLPFPDARYVAGLSMGGYGAIKLGLRNPSVFSFAASFSGAFDWLTRTETPSVNTAFGPPGGAFRQEQDLLTIIEATNSSETPYLYLDVGTSDAVIEGNRAVVRALSEMGIAYEYHEVPGDHSWEYWNRRLPVVLELLRERIHRLSPAPR